MWNVIEAFNGWLTDSANPDQTLAFPLLKGLRSYAVGGKVSPRRNSWLASEGWGRWMWQARIGTIQRRAQTFQGHFVSSMKLDILRPLFLAQVEQLKGRVNGRLAICRHLFWRSREITGDIRPARWATSVSRVGLQL